MKIAIIGAGASGMVAALNLAKNNLVYVFEKNSDVGKKLLLTGSGRCNLGNVDNSLSKYHSSNDELIKYIINYSNLNKVNELFKEIGLVIKNKNGYLYPFSEKSSSVLSALKNACLESKVNFRFCSTILNVEKINDKFIVNGEKFDKLIVATGGCSYPKTGSVGIGYDIAKNFGHNITDLFPSLVPLYTKNSLEKEWKGIRCEAIVSLYENDKFIKSEHGELQLNSEGLSGICIFNLSRNIKLGLNHNCKEEIRINFTPWTNDLRSFLDNFKDKKVSVICDGFMDYKLTNILYKYLGIDTNKTWNELRDLDKNKIVDALTDFKVDIKDTKGYLDAQVTCGGVCLDEINLNDMSSKFVNNLYFIGEVLDLDGDCGGYNLTIAFITGLLAGGNND